MKGIRMLIILVFVVALAFPEAALARKGVGLVWKTESEIVNEGVSHCIEYGIYNPWDEDVYALLSVSDELKGVLINEKSETKLIKAGTAHGDAVPVELCFKTAEIYKKDCLVGGYLCKQVCQEQPVTYKGKVNAMEKKSEGPSGGTAGSVTSLGVSVPLKLKVNCVAGQRNWVPVYVVVIVLILILIAVELAKRKKKGM